MVPINSICIGTDKRKHILLVEDEGILALYESRILQKHGMTVEIAHSGENAIDLIKKKKLPAMILMDIDLGNGIDGIEAARAILSQWQIPIVFLTSHNSAEIIKKTKGIKHYGYIAKASEEFIIISTIKTAIELFQNEITIKKSAVRKSEKKDS